MNRSEYKAITRGQGARVRAFLKSAVSKHPETSRAALVAQLEDAEIPEAQHDALIETYTAAAKKAQAGESLFELGQLVDRAAVEHVREMRASDSVLDDDGIPAEPEPDAKAADRVWGAIRGESEHDTERRREAEAERDRLRELGVEVA